MYEGVSLTKVDIHDDVAVQSHISSLFHSFYLIFRIKIR